ncbi:LPS export ABC transporter permease LptF [Pseudooceanicola sp. CBS1P-1]|uniref:LPS export ABC transporter permease LptF n=1 Tax=Pseudooceanicola albus TaxID=2692189 RepID=A0A6L7FYE5_9RHOB|nr:MULTISPECIES: LPS export ABC transporter permease LptF [Pseudooceanicola]MBT9383225.1 LPS export ABC transporter permease LptF [Pseudooceanicola endophyticus]MXN16452.1 LPS export ABC transporter permease LptF [Pseudooceanicola albus]
MARFDRYLLSQLMMLFGFFTLVLVAIYWINAAVQLFDRLLGDGQTALVFLEYSALTLPGVIRTVLPIAVFAAAVYVTNRLSSDSELVVMRATGFSPWRLARPALVFGLIAAAMMSLLTQVLVPLSQQEMQTRDSEIARNITARMLTEGAFLHPTSGVTFYIRDIDDDGTLRDVFLSDRRNAEEPQTFTAARAYIVNTASKGSDGPAPKLVMVDGLTQSLEKSTQRLFTTHFQDMTYDIGSFIKSSDSIRPTMRGMSTLTLLADPDAAGTLTGNTRGRILQEAHGRITQALLCIAAALIGFAALQIGGFSRFGVWKQIIIAVALLVLLKGIEGGVTGPVRKDGDLWPLLYLPSLVGLLISAALLWWAARPIRRRQRRAEAPA